MTRRLRLISGLILLTFVVTHFLNHSLGLVSLEALERGRQAFLILWRNPLGTLLLYGALLCHVVLALTAVYRRRSLRLRLVDWVQLACGVAIPFLLAIHILGSRGAAEFFGTEDNYLYELLIFYVFNTGRLPAQLLMVILVWVHGVIGFHQWFRLQPLYKRFRWPLFSLAILLPAAALAGFWVGGRDVMVLAQDAAWVSSVSADLRFPNDEQVALLYRSETIFLWIWTLLLGALLAHHFLRDSLRRGIGRVEIRYGDGRRITVARGTTVLEASRLGKIPHASVCGGRGRCSTCRIRVADAGSLPLPSEAESKVLRRIRAADNVRLACQLRPEGDCEVMPLLAPGVDPANLRARRVEREGREKEITILFADLRGFTALSESRLPYDVVFILNRYFDVMGRAIETAGGRVDKFIGDGIMALFGTEGTVEAGCRDALRAAAAMSQALEELNQSLAGDLDSPLRIGIGLHVGPVILGEMGYGATISLTAVGDSVNTASRLEGMTKNFGVQLVVSYPVLELAGLETADFPVEKVAIRGRSEPLEVLALADPRGLPLAQFGSGGGKGSARTRRATS